MMSRNLRFARSKRNPPAAPRRGFTLVELLVVMIILGILASMVSFAMFRSQQSARQAKTQALIAKLHTVIARQWDTYATRRVDEADAGTRLNKIRLEMQYELPDCQAGVTGTGGVLQTAYAAAINSEWPANPETENPEHDESAVCLYLIVSMLADDDLDRINFFSEQEVGDLDDDGKPDVFVDAWGEPIGFIRWPAGFASDLQDRDSTNSPDPFDPTGEQTGTFAIFPLIYSKGPDKQSGIDPTGPPLNPPEPYAPNAGQPSAGTESTHHDNIHNHRLNAQLR